ncbi:MAG: hypothetical protein ABI619_03985, partial [Betaproteobacteria bacterium]
GSSLGMQCHVEMTQDLIESWCATGAGEIASSSSPAVQTRDQIRLEMGQKLDALRAVASRLYDRWTGGIRRNRSLQSLKLPN